MNEKVTQAIEGLLYVKYFTFSRFTTSIKKWSGILFEKILILHHLINIELSSLLINPRTYYLRPIINFYF